MIKRESMEKDIDRIWMKLFNREELDRGEEEAFREWEACSREHRAVSSVLKRLIAAEKGGEYRGWEDAYARAASRVHRERRWRWMRVAGVAASVLLVLGVAFVLSEKRHQTVVSPVEREVVQVSGVELISPDGQSYSLERDSVEVVVSDSCGEMRIHDKMLLVSARENALEEAEYYTIKVPVGGEYTVLLPDSTRIYLNAGTVLRYPNRFVGKKREVFLSGEAYFDVHHDEAHPFVVTTERVAVQVLGTSFNVNAYPGWREVKTTLVEGKVSVSMKGVRDSVVMKPGTQVVYDKDSGQWIYRRVNVSHFVSWKEGYYDFEDMPLEELMFIFSNWYDLEIIYENDGVKNLRFGGRLQRYDDVDRLLRQLEYTQDVHFELKGNKLIVK